MICRCNLCSRLDAILLPSSVDALALQVQISEQCLRSWHILYSESWAICSETNMCRPQREAVYHMHRLDRSLSKSPWSTLQALDKALLNYITYC